MCFFQEGQSLREKVESESVCMQGVILTVNSKFFSPKDWEEEITLHTVKMYDLVPPAPVGEAGRRNRSGRRQ